MSYGGDYQCDEKYKRITTSDGFSDYCTSLTPKILSIR